MRVVNVTIEDGSDGVTRVSSEDLPGLILAGVDRPRLLGAIAPAAKELLRAKGELTEGFQINATFIRTPPQRQGESK